MPLRALLWDVDGTLAETERDGHRVAFNRAFAECGVALHWDQSAYGRWLTIPGGAERLRAALAALEGEEPSADRVATLQACKQSHYAQLVRAGTLELRPGVAALIAAAAAAALDQGVVTTSGRAAVRELEQRLLGEELAAAFSVRICGEDVVRKKPDPEAYRLALAQLGAGEGTGQTAGVVAIEDSLPGLRAARAAGLPCLVTLSHYGVQDLAPLLGEASAVVSQLGEGGSVLGGPVLGGPACQGGGIALSYIQALV